MIRHLTLLLLLTAGAMALPATGPAAPAATDPAAPAASPAPAAGAVQAVVTTTGGDRISGTLVAMASGGTLRMTGPQFQGEAAIRADAVAGISLLTAAKLVGSDEVSLMGGDRLRGTLKAIAADTVVFEIPSAGTLKIPRRAVQSINRLPPEDVLVDSRFALGRMDPWKPTSTSAALWAFDGGALVSRAAPGQQAALYARFTHGEPVTVEVLVRGPEGGSLAIGLRLSDGSTPGDPRKRRRQLYQQRRSDRPGQHQVPPGRQRWRERLRVGFSDQRGCPVAAAADVRPRHHGDDQL